MTTEDHLWAGPSLTRRSFVRHIAAFGTIAVPTLLAACTPAASAPAAKPAPGATTAPGTTQTLRTIKFTHGGGLCNMPLFYGAEKKLFEQYGIRSDVVLAPV